MNPDSPNPQDESERALKRLLYAELNRMAFWQLEWLVISILAVVAILIAAAISESVRITTLISGGTILATGIHAWWLERCAYRGLLKRLGFEQAHYWDI